MEKLQSALEKARAKRQSGGHRLAQPRPALGGHRRKGKPDPATEHDAAWQALNAIDLDHERLLANRVFALKAGQSATEFDILRTKIQLMMRKNNWTRLAVTSPTPACGKTTTACNLVAGFTRQADICAILFELDLHRPKISETLGFDPVADITEVLSGKVPFAEQAVRLGNNVAISAARRAAHDPTAVLLNRRTHNALTAIDALYRPDIVIFDLPPLLTSDDTRAFLSDVDCALLVARAEATTINQIDLCEREIAEQTNFLGVVLNQCRFTTPDQGYGYGYGMVDAVPTDGAS